MQLEQVLIALVQGLARTITGGPVHRRHVDQLVSGRHLARQYPVLVDEAHVGTVQLFRHLLDGHGVAVLAQVLDHAVVGLMDHHRKAHRLVERLQAGVGNRDQGHAVAAQDVQRGLGALADVFVEVGPELGGQAQAQLAEYDRRQRALAGDQRVEQRHVGHAQGHRAHGVAAAGDRNHPVVAVAPLARTQRGAAV
ncbi:hypothetical protein D9M69_462310 [compost metagenome]